MINLTRSNSYRQTFSHDLFLFALADHKQKKEDGGDYDIYKKIKGRQNS